MRCRRTRLFVLNSAPAQRTVQTISGCNKGWKVSMRFLTIFVGLILLLVPVAWQAQQESPQRAGGDSALLAQLPHQKRTVVGSIVENDSTIQVLYRTQISDDPQGPPHGNAVAIPRRAGRDWRLWPSEGGLFNENGFGGSFPPARNWFRGTGALIAE